MNGFHPSTPTALGLALRAGREVTVRIVAQRLFTEVLIACAIHDVGHNGRSLVLGSTPNTGCHL